MPCESIYDHVKNLIMDCQLRFINLSCITQFISNSMDATSKVQSIYITFFQSIWKMKSYQIYKIWVLNFIILTALLFPPNCICLNCCHVQFVSNWVDLTKLTCTPKLRCTAEQSIHIKIPYVTLDHVGFLALQSKHT